MPTGYDNWKTSPDADQLEREKLNALCEQATDALRARVYDVMRMLRELGDEYKSQTGCGQCPGIETALDALADEFREGQ